MLKEGDTIFHLMIRNLSKDQKNERRIILVDDLHKNFKKRHEDFVKKLYDDFKFQCANCGLRLTTTLKLQEHYNKHFLQNRRNEERLRKGAKRDLFLSLKGWLESDIELTDEN